MQKILEENRRKCIKLGNPEEVTSRYMEKNREARKCGGVEETRLPEGN